MQARLLVVALSLAGLQPCSSSGGSNPGGGGGTGGDPPARASCKPAACGMGLQRPFGGETGAFDREFSLPGYSAITSTIAIPEFNASSGYPGDPYIYFVFWNSKDKMEAGLGWQKGGVPGKPPRMQPYVSNPNGRKQQFCTNMQDWRPNLAGGGQVQLSAWYDGTRVHLAVDGTEATFGDVLDNEVSLVPGEIQVGRVVGDAIPSVAGQKLNYTGARLATIGPVVFTGTFLGTSPTATSVPFDSVLCTGTQGCGDGTVKWPDCEVTASLSQDGSVKTVTLFGGSGIADPLGRVWNEVEGGGQCPSTWTRIGNTSTFTDAQPSCGVTAKLTVTVDGSHVSVARTDSSDGNDCSYDGSLSADCSSVIGTYSCTTNNSISGPWSATIQD